VVVGDGAGVNGRGRGGGGGGGVEGVRSAVGVRRVAVCTTRQVAGKVRLVGRRVTWRWEMEKKKQGWSGVANWEGIRGITLAGLFYRKQAGLGRGLKQVITDGSR